MFDNFAENLIEFFWCEPDDGLAMNAPETLYALRQCEGKLPGGVTKLRKLFADGSTVFLMGDKMVELDDLGVLDELEIRVFNSRNSLVCVLVNDEICW